ncbi:TonB-dependent receptor domain-containing protein [Lutibacter sp.]|uniref:TonB-dependent receptor domain-containing protein n=1 Tax=Lutibacter sp. TaxID=1925666 RepID=UPI00356B60EA
MKLYNKVLFFGFFLSSLCVYSQKDTIVTLKVVNLQSVKLYKHSKGLKVLDLTDSIIAKNATSFTSLLRFNTPIYIKEYGAGGTSSASFRGTSASNTAVIWNGININSINNGQTEFNSLNISLFDNINVRSGGGSIEFGSGAVGGTIHLNNELGFGAYSKHQVISTVGSYQTFHNLYKYSFGSETTAIKLGAAYNTSKNNYKWLDYNLENENGAYQQRDFNFSIAQKINDFTKISFFSSKYNGVRHFSGQLPNPSAAKEKYKDFSFRNLVNFNYHKKTATHNLKLAYLTQEYRYFADKNKEDYNFGKSKRYLINYDFSYKISSNSSIESFSEFESVDGKTDQIATKNRAQFSQSLIYNQRYKNLASLNAKVRKDFNSEYNVPFVFALGIEIKPLRNTFVRANGSKNYRVPSYNDLYWPALGNKNLIPESSLQGEIGVGYKNNQFKIDLGAFYIDAKDKIVWTPGGDPDKPGVWTPINIDKVVNKGLEISTTYSINFVKHYIDLNTNYSYTIAKDKKTNDFIPYVPKHLLNSSISYSFKRINFYYQHLFNGKVYTTKDIIDSYAMPSFNIGNFGGSYNLIKNLKKELQLGFKINNVFNKAYQVLPGRPMPNRNINFNINYKF